MKISTRLALVALTAAFLSACAEPDAALPVPGGPLNQQQLNQTTQDLSVQLMALLERAAQDRGVTALRGFPQDSVMTNPFFGYGVGAARRRSGDTNRRLGALAKTDLPRGAYAFTASGSSGTWVQTGAADDLSLTWTYDATPETPALDPAVATATFDWDALSPTLRAGFGAGSQTLEVPTGLNLSLEADGESAADLGVETTYYTGCGAPTLEPTSVTVDGAGSLLNLENVGYRVRESDAGDSVTTQGQVNVVGKDVGLEWNIAVNGELIRQGCFTESFAPENGAVSVRLGGFTGDTRSVALELTFSGHTAPDLRGSVVVNDDDDNAISFSGTLSDANGNGIPGEDVTVRFADGSRTTLEKLLERLSSVRALGVLLRHP